MPDDNARIFESKYTIQDICKKDLRTLFAIKKQKRQNKGKEFNCFVTDYPEFKFLLKRLNLNIKNLPNGLRFQIAFGGDRWHFLSKLGFIEHNFLIDFYIQNNTLHTLSIDAINIHSILKNVLKLLIKDFPEGLHYYFDDRDGSIQYGSDECSTFTREHAALISNMNPNKLYAALNIQAQANSSIVNGAKFFTFKDLIKDDMGILAPIFRGMQSISKIKGALQGIKKHKVSEKTGESLEQWVDSHTYDEKVFEEGEVSLKKVNRSINIKFDNYNEEFCEFKNSTNQNIQNYGLGFIAISATIDNFLKNKNRDDIKNSINEFCDYLAVMPKHKQVLKFFETTLPHHKVTKRTLNELVLLRLQCEDQMMTELTIKNQFKQIIEDYTDKILRENYKIAYKYLNDFFDNHISLEQKAFTDILYI